MADIDITPTELAFNEASDDIVDGDLTSISSSGSNQFVVAAGARHGDRLMLKASAGAAGDTLVIKAGDRPPSQRAGLGDLSITLAANDVKYLCVEAARFLKSDGTIVATCGDDDTAMGAFVIPHQLAGDET